MCIDMCIDMRIDMHIDMRMDRNTIELAMNLLVQSSLAKHYLGQHYSGQHYLGQSVHAKFLGADLGCLYPEQPRAALGSQLGLQTQAGYVPCTVGKPSSSLP